MCGQSKTVAAQAVSLAVAQNFEKGQMVVASSDSTDFGSVYYRRGDVGVIVSTYDGDIRVNFEGFPGNSKDLTPSPRGCGGPRGYSVDTYDLIALNGLMVQPADLPAEAPAAAPEAALESPEIVPAYLFKEGDKAKVVRKVEKEVGYSNSWVPGMDTKVGNGEAYTVENVTHAGVFFKETGMGWPHSALELVTEEPEVAPEAPAEPAYAPEIGDRVKLTVQLSSLRAGETAKVASSNGEGSYRLESIGCGPTRFGFGNAGADFVAA